MRFRGGLVFKAQGWLYQSTPGSAVIKKKKKDLDGVGGAHERAPALDRVVLLQDLKTGGDKEDEMPGDCVVPEVTKLTREPWNLIHIYIYI